ncbi:cysteine protease precursor TacP [Theileria orientalis strain Shintoku]|uniref:Cysteine protease TacP n=1 Tax=Theileria orientalis strain Shintoku TaxID=869250 RepID=J4DPU3_THEOR|nr:cysteine protease precursor TacP [Theileria orientalis strain Shintoku]BAM41304.1 cysteine protease precursor TacP [Theileria orientalis strain Shintoku]|eukprot:XP_009691605.1 cysteine protease precursor TacP [Theileria orientalis strain Shintoku]
MATNQSIHIYRWGITLNHILGRKNSDPSQSLISNRFDDVEHTGNDDQVSLKKSFRSTLTKKRIVIISGVVLSVLLVVGLTLTGVFVSRAQYAKKFTHNLQNHLKSSFPSIDEKLTEAYVKELSSLYERREISYDHVKEFEALRSFEKFKADYNKVHATDDERRERFLVFRNNYLETLTHKGHETFTKSVNFFSDLTEEELNRLFPKIEVPKESSPSEHLERLMSSRSTDPNFLAKLALAKGFQSPVKSLDGISGESIDWRKANGVTKVKDQGMCGSCWAFASVGSVESLYKIHTDKVLDLSEQELVNCETKSHGCEGGFGDTALEYVKNKGISSSADVPYHAMDQTCDIKTHDKVFINSFMVTKGKDVMNKSLVLSPTVVYIAASSELMMYKAGVFNGACAKELNHAVLLVGEGYDDIVGKRYWVIKNSWGPHWGEDGYVRLERTDKGTDKCGVLDTGVTPLL